MLKAVQNGKLKIQLIEDSLTSSIFQLLMYLPNDLLANIFQEIIGNKIYEADDLTLGNFKGIEYWGKWDATGTSNKNFVEPDILLSFENIDIVVEAKRYDKEGQNREQWKREIIAYHNEYPNGEKKMAIWALGGNKNLKSIRLTIGIQKDKVNSKRLSSLVIKTTWIKLLTIIKSEYLKLCNQTKENETSGISQIFEDLILSFQIHRFFVGTWMSEIGFSPINLSETSINYFNNSQKYDSQKWLYSLEPINLTLKNLKYFQ